MIGYQFLIPNRKPCSMALRGMAFVMAQNISSNLSHHFTSESDTMPCKKIDKPDLVMLRNDVHYNVA